MKKENLTATLLAAMITACLSSNVLAATYDVHWVEGTGKNAGKWQYMENDNFDFPFRWWKCLDDNNDGIAEFYRFDKDGWLLTDTITPDGFTVNHDGALTVDGEVQYIYKNVTGSDGKLAYEAGELKKSANHTYVNTEPDIIERAGYTRGVSNVAIDMLGLGNRALIDSKYEVEYVKEDKYFHLVKYKNIPFIVNYGNHMAVDDYADKYLGQNDLIIDISENRNVLIKDINNPYDDYASYRHLCDLGYPSIGGSFQFISVPEEPRLNYVHIRISEADSRLTGDDRVLVTVW